LCPITSLRHVVLLSRHNSAERRTELNWPANQAIHALSHLTTLCDWWEALKTALGTCSNAFVTASLAQLQGAARLPDGPVSETAMNAALALIEAVAPQNEIEGALAVQMAATHSASMAVMARIGSAHSG